jgi:hypothetical protein
LRRTQCPWRYDQTTVSSPSETGPHTVSTFELKAFIRGAGPGCCIRGTGGSRRLLARITTPGLFQGSGQGSAGLSSRSSASSPCSSHRLGERSTASTFSWKPRQFRRTTRAKLITRGSNLKPFSLTVGCLPVELAAMATAEGLNLDSSRYIEPSWSTSPPCRNVEGAARPSPCCFRSRHRPLRLGCRVVVCA